VGTWTELRDVFTGIPEKWLLAVNSSLRMSMTSEYDISHPVHEESSIP
jgi:hypothetical protein